MNRLEKIYILNIVIVKLLGSLMISKIAARNSDIMVLPIVSSNTATLERAFELNQKYNT